MKPQTQNGFRNRSPLHGVSVLFVDESPDERELFSARFGRDCGQLASAASVEEALEVLGLGETELLVTEIRLSGHSGLELVQRMHELPAARAGAVPAIAASAWTGAGRGSVQVPTGFAGYVLKPYDAQELLVVVAEVSTAIAALRRLRAREGAGRVAEREL